MLTCNEIPSSCRYVKRRRTNTTSCCHSYSYNLHLVCQDVIKLRFCSNIYYVWFIWVKFSVGLTKYHTMKTYGGMEVCTHAFLTSALDGSKWSASWAGRFTPGKRAPGTPWIGGSVDPRTGLDTVGKRKVPVPAGNRTSVVQPVV